MAIYRVTKDIPVTVFVSANNEDDALIKADSFWAAAHQELADALTNAFPFLDTDIGFFYDDIDVTPEADLDA